MGDSGGKPYTAEHTYDAYHSYTTRINMIEELIIT